MPIRTGGPGAALPFRHTPGRARFRSPPLNSLGPAVMGAGSPTFNQAFNNQASAVSGITVTASIPAGHTVVICCSQNVDNVQTLAISDSTAGLNTYVQTGAGYSSRSSTNRMAMFVGVLAQPITSITGTWSGAISATVDAVVFDLGNTSPSLVEDSSINSNGVAATLATSGALSTTNPGDILIFGTQLGSAISAPSAGAGYTLPTNGSNSHMIMTYQIVSAAQSGVAALQTWTTSSTWTTIFAAFKGIGAIAAIVNGTSTEIAAITGTGALAAVVNGIGTETVAAIGTGAAASPINGVATEIVALSGSGALAGTIAGVGSEVVAATGIGAVAGAIIGTATVTAAISGGVGLISATINGTSTVTVVASGTGAAAGIINGVATETVLITGAGILAATIFGTSAEVAALTGAGALVGSIAGIGTLTSTLTGKGSVAGIISGTSVVIGALAGAGALVGAINGVGSVIAALGGTGTVAATINGTSVVTVRVTGVGSLAASIAGTSAVIVALGSGSLSATILGAGTVSSTLTGASPLASNIAGAATITSSLVGVGAIIAAVAGIGTVACTILGAGAIICTINGTSVLLCALTSNTTYGAAIGGTATISATILNQPIAQSLTAIGNCNTLIHSMPANGQQVADIQTQMTSVLQAMAHVTTGSGHGYGFAQATLFIAYMMRALVLSQQAQNLTPPGNLLQALRANEIELNVAYSRLLRQAAASTDNRQS